MISQRSKEDILHRNCHLVDSTSTAAVVPTSSVPIGNAATTASDVCNNSTSGLFCRDIEYLNFSPLVLIPPEVPGVPPVARSTTLRDKYIFASRLPAGPAEADKNVSQDSTFKLGRASPTVVSAAGTDTAEHAHSSDPADGSSKTVSSLSAGLAAAAAALSISASNQSPRPSSSRKGGGFMDSGSRSRQPQSQVGLGITSDYPDSPATTYVGDSCLRRPHVPHSNPAKAATIPRCTSRQSSPADAPGTRTMPVHIPSASAQSYDRFLNSPPSTISSESSSPSGAEVDSQSWFTARHRDSRGGIRRSRHSLSVNIVRRKTANSGGSSPVTSGSYSSLAQSPAVSFLATLADMSANKSTQPTGEYNPGDQVGDYILGREVGSGAFSRVFEAEVIDGPHKHMGKVAIKVIRKDLHKDAQEIQRLVDHETNIWARLRHPHILEMLDLMDGEDAIFIVSELACNGNLLDLIRKETRIPEARARKLFLQIADAVRYIHQEVQVIHRDIKCENILLDCEGNTKLADFGLAVEWTPPTNPGEPPTEPVFCSGSLHYCSPEELKQSTHYNPASDIWSLGCVLFAMLAGSLPFNDGFLPRLQKMIVNGRYDVSKLANANVSQSAKDLIAGMLRTKPEERFSMRDIMNHPWVMHEAGAC